MGALVLLYPLMNRFMEITSHACTSIDKFAELRLKCHTFQALYNWYRITSAEIAYKSIGRRGSVRQAFRIQSNFASSNPSKKRRMTGRFIAAAVLLFATLAVVDSVIVVAIGRRRRGEQQQLLCITTVLWFCITCC